MPFEIASYPAATVAPRRVINGFTSHAQPQQKSLWCWAAVCSACSYVVGNAPLTQEQIVAAAFGPDLPNADSSLDDALRSARLKARLIDGDTPNIDSIREALDALQPVTIAIEWTNGLGHAVCAYGYEFLGDGLALSIFDPLEPDSDGDRFRTVPAARMASYFEGPLHGTTGGWTQAYRVIGNA